MAQSTTPRPHRTERRPGGLIMRALAALTVAVAVLGTPVGAHAAHYPVPQPPVRLPAALDPIAPYQPQSTCSPTAKPGALALRQLILATYPGTRDYGIVRACDIGGISEHKEGRAWDWGVDVNNPTEAAEAATLLHWLTKRDRRGRIAANARRLGIMYVIWNDHIWSPARAGEGWRPYVNASCSSIPLTSCSPTLRHRDHVHFSLSWNGAYKLTSFWTGVVHRQVAAPAPPSLAGAAVAGSPAGVRVPE